MADKRKLQGEIDKCLKKVTEGVETFEEIWQKVHTAANANQKEKYEADLKKEIKKLQRLRDNIKTWLTSNDIKDKKSLMDNRKLIETQMERFKVVERETKTKAYSKEGLGLATKIDPAQKEKDEVRQWLTDSIDQLQMQIDQFESEIESVHVGSKRKKLDRDKQDRVDELCEWVERHKFHVQKLETIMRMLDNCSLETETVKLIQDDLQYYLECNQEPDFAENELIYEDLELDDGPNITPTTGHVQSNDDDMSSLASSPTSSGPLSPKTPTGTMRSTSQELFEDRRRGKTTSTSSDYGNEPVPPSPRRPGPKSLQLNTTVTTPNNKTSVNNSKIVTPPSNMTNSLGSTRVTTALQQPLSSPITTISTVNTLPVSPSQESPKPLLITSSVKTQPLSMTSAYAVAAGGNQSSSSGSSDSSTGSTGSSGSITTPSNLTELTAAVLLPSHTVLDQTGSLSEPITTSTMAPPISSTPSTAPSIQTSHSVGRLQDLPSLSSEHSHSSSNSSLSPVLTPPKENQPLLHSDGSIPHTSQDSVISGPNSQATNSPNLSIYTGISENTSPNGSPTGQPTTALSPTSTSMTSSTSSSSSQQQVSVLSRSISRTDSGGNVMPFGSPSAVGSSGIPCTSHGTIASAIMSVTTSDILFGSSLTALPLSGNPPSVVTSFPLQSTEPSFSPSSLGSLGVSSIPCSTSTSGIPIDTLGFTSSGLSKDRNSGWPSPPLGDTALGLSSLKDMAAVAVATHELLEEGKTDLPDQSLRPLLNPAPGARLDSTLLTTVTTTSTTRTDNQMQPLLGVAPLGPVPLNQDRVYQLKMLEAVFKHLPEPSDSERVRPYLQRTPYPTPSYHHQHPPTHMDSFEFYQRLSIETLFFIFYYMEGTKAQYMAAKALKKLSWRFHTKYMTWFQRLEEPKTITDDYEMGTYIYFDYEKWAQRKKDGFTFEYRYLEDRELP